MKLNSTICIGKQNPVYTRCPIIFVHEVNPFTELLALKNIEEKQSPIQKKNETFLLNKVISIFEITILIEH